MLTYTYHEIRNMATFGLCKRATMIWLFSTMNEICVCMQTRRPAWLLRPQQRVERQAEPYYIAAMIDRATGLATWPIGGAHGSALATPTLWQYPGKWALDRALHAWSLCFCFSFAFHFFPRWWLRFKRVTNTPTSILIPGFCWSSFYLEIRSKICSRT